MNPITIEAFSRDAHGALISRPEPIAALGGKLCQFQLRGFDGDAHPEDFLQAVDAVRRASRSLLLDATPHVHEYCLDVLALWGDEAPELDVERPEDVWRHVELGNVLVLSRDSNAGRDVFVSLECGCAWDEEHGLQLVFANGRSISRVGPIDGDVSNTSAFDDPSLAGVVYKRIAD